MPNITLTLDGEQYSADARDTILTIAREHGVNIPTLCHLDGLSPIGACRLCLVEIEGSPKLQPACTTVPAEGMVIHTNTEKLQRYRRMIIEMMLSEGNHHCAVCIVNGSCELQDMAAEVGLTHVRFPYLFPNKTLDASHKSYAIDRNRCVLCNRCVRVCHEVEGAHVWDIAGRGLHCTIISDMNQPWGESEACTACGKCVRVCPTGALIERGVGVSEMHKGEDFLKYIVTARNKKKWVAKGE